MLNPLVRGRMAAESISLGGRVLKAVENSNGEVGSETEFEFEQEGEVITASYSGGDILQGYLVGTLESNQWNVRYVQINQDGETATGHSIGEISLTEGGRVRVDDKWEWESQPGEGQSVLKEIWTYAGRPAG